MESPYFHRKTRQRQVILEELQKLNTHPTASELYDIARARIPNISLGTVYRNLDLLAEAGLILKIHVSGSQVRFDPRTDCHCHTRCVKCGRIEDIHGIDTESMQDQFREINGYEIHRMCLELVGICPYCQKRNEE